MRWSNTEKIVVRRALKEMLSMSGAGLTLPVLHPGNGQVDASVNTSVQSWVRWCAQMWDVELEIRTEQHPKARIHRRVRRSLGSSA